MDINIDFIVRNHYKDEVIKIEDIETFVKKVFWELKKDGRGDNFVEYILSEASDPFEEHTKFNNSFIKTAFYMLDKNDWDKNEAFKK